jgi:hypothetical protein
MVLAVSAIAGCKNSGIGSVNDRSDLGSGEGLDPCDVSLLNGLDPIWMVQNGWELPCADIDNDGIENECDIDLTLGEDCNENGIDDLCELDSDEDGTIDDCECEVIAEDGYNAGLEEGDLLEEFGEEAFFELLDAANEDASNCLELDAEGSVLFNQSTVIVEIRRLISELSDDPETTDNCFDLGFLSALYEIAVLEYNSEFQAFVFDHDLNEDGIVDRCQGGRRKVKICHKGRTIKVSINALPAHLSHGDTLGECGE